jgi:hypothetical protein
MTRKTITALSVVLTLAASAAPALALNPQPLPPKEGRYVLIKRHPLNVLKRHSLKSKILLKRSTVVR